MLTTTTMSRHAMRKARAAHRARKTAYADARRQGRCIPFGFDLPSWAEGLDPTRPADCTIGTYIANQFSPIEE